MKSKTLRIAAAAGMASVMCGAAIAGPRPVSLPVGEATYVGADGAVRTAQRLVQVRPLCGMQGQITRGEMRRAVSTVLRRMEDPIAPGAVIRGGGGETSTPQAGGMTIVFNVMGTAPAGAMTTLQQVADFYRTQFSDDVTITIDVEFSAAAFGFASSTLAVLDYADVRQFMIDDADPNDTIQAALPMGTLPVLPAIGGPVEDASTMVVNSATLRALGQDGLASAVDATITLGPGTDTGGLLDYDDSDGVSVFAFSALDVITHEVGHALGFTSSVGGTLPGPTTLDLFRFDSTTLPTDAATFTATPRLQDGTAASVGRHVLTDATAAAPLENGVNFQSSHWENRDAMPLGIMDPQIINGTTLSPALLSVADLTAFDAIGWDFPFVSKGCNAADLSPDFGVLNVNDVIVFANAFNAMEPLADLSPPGAPDGILNVNDVIEFANTFNAGCP